MTETGLRCADPACTDGPEAPDGSPMPRWAKDGLLCRRCGTLLEQRLAEVPARREALRAELGGLRSSSRGENRPTKGSPPIPLNIPVHDHLEKIHATLVSWVLLVAEERALRGPDRDDDAILSAWLLSQFDWLLQHEAVGDFADEMRDLSRHADGLTQTREQWHRLEPLCPDCGARELGRWDGGDYVGCRSCGQRWAEEQYPMFVRLALDDSGGCVTAAEAVDRAQVAPATFRQWVSRGRVRKLGTVDGLARYSTADLDDVLNSDGIAS